MVSGVSWWALELQISPPHLFGRRLPLLWVTSILLRIIKVLLYSRDSGSLVVVNSRQSHFRVANCWIHSSPACSLPGWAASRGCVLLKHNLAIMMLRLWKLNIFPGVNCTVGSNRMTNLELQGGREGFIKKQAIANYSKDAGIRTSVWIIMSLTWTWLWLVL